MIAPSMRGTADLASVPKRRDLFGVMRTKTGLILLTLVSIALAADWREGSRWGRGRFRPEKTNHAFATSDGRALCQSASDRATANWSATGEDIAPYGVWRGTMMANAFRDP